jgi:hypothetical protein
MQTGDRLDGVTRQQYTDLVNSFDAQGNLISNSITDQGVTISRALDQQGTLLINRFDQNGTPLGNNMLDVPAMIAEAESFRQQVMGTPETPEAGFAGANPLPYTLTR